MQREVNISRQRNMKNGTLTREAMIMMMMTIRSFYIMNITDRDEYNWGILERIMTRILQTASAVTIHQTTRVIMHQDKIHQTTTVMHPDRIHQTTPVMHQDKVHQTTAVKIHPVKIHQNKPVLAILIPIAMHWEYHYNLHWHEQTNSMIWVFIYVWVVINQVQKKVWDPSCFDLHVVWKMHVSQHHKIIWQMSISIIKLWGVPGALRNMLIPLCMPLLHIKHKIYKVVELFWSPNFLF